MATEPSGSVCVGQKYLNLRDELDSADPSDEAARPYCNQDFERTTPAGNVWVVTSHSHDDVWNIVCDKTGAWICPTEAELAAEFQLIEEA